MRQNLKIYLMPLALLSVATGVEAKQKNIILIITDDQVKKSLESTLRTCLPNEKAKFAGTTRKKMTLISAYF